MDTKNLDTKDQILKIQRFWRAYKDNQLYKLLVFFLRRLESLPFDQLMKLILPEEAQMLKDNGLYVPKLKFRLIGKVFPPHICFKVYYQAKWCSIAYYCGRQQFNQSSGRPEEGAREHVSPVMQKVLQMVGHRRCTMAILQDCAMFGLLEGSRICRGTSPSKERSIFIMDQSDSLVDDLPAYLGGKQNSWRLLDGKVLLRDSFSWGVLNRLNKSGKHHQSAKHPHHLSLLYATQPNNTEPICRAFLRHLDGQLGSQDRRKSRRRDASQLQRIEKMRAIYQQRTDRGMDKSNVKEPNNSMAYLFNEELCPLPDFRGPEIVALDDMYKWSQNLPEEITTQKKYHNLNCMISQI
ncbi:unnamed protein product [Calicophoron daubneyi]|uniref:Uncharacterized protein n=1 Tax=Calicophoron daubneyi TaxID=300641 RepID=A0AAV2TDE1_CALDB